MSCTCEFASLIVRDAHDYSDDYAKFREDGLLAVNFELTNHLAELTRGADFRYCTTDRRGDTLDPCGVTLIPTETLLTLKNALVGLTAENIPEYNAEFDDSPYNLPDQLASLTAMIDEAIKNGEWLICFGV